MIDKMDNTIVKMIYGSQLYGLELPTSDQDYKGVFFPNLNDILLGRIPKSISESVKNSTGIKNEAGDVDSEFYSLHNFINMCCDGNTIVLDMLHAPKEMLLFSSPLWENIVSKRHMFYTKRLNSYLGYARNQVSKYGKKGDRLNSALMVKNNLLIRSQVYMSSIWDSLYTDENVEFVELETLTGIQEFYEVCGRKIQKTLKISDAIEIVDNIIKKYGERSKKSLDGTDYKAVTHAVRACFQLKELYSEGTITFPLKKRDFLMKVKTGQLEFENEISPLLENLFAQVEELCNKSSYPEKVDRKYWNEFIIDAVKNKYFR